MTARSPQNTAASVHQRLKNEADATGQLFNEVLQHYALERFLYRLSQSDQGDRFVLKGALLLRVWGLTSVRATRDIDLLGQASNEAGSISAIIQDMCTIAVEDDGLVFDAESVKVAQISEDAEYERLGSNSGGGWAMRGFR